MFRVLESLISGKSASQSARFVLGQLPIVGFSPAIQRAAEEAARKSKLAVERALELDPDLAEAYAANGSIQM
jgi:hypothetical protein